MVEVLKDSAIRVQSSTNECPYCGADYEGGDE
nr:MAG TPA: Rad50 zinc hook motif [Caudoviricetes sp.]